MTKRRPTISAGGMLLFYRPRGPGVLVSLLTRSPYYHVAIVVDSKHVVEAMPNGVVQSDLQSKRGEHFVFIPSAVQVIGRESCAVGEGENRRRLRPKRFGRHRAYPDVRHSSPSLRDRRSLHVR